MYLSAICCSNDLANFFASKMCFGSTIFDFFSSAKSPDALIKPPSSLSLNVNFPDVSALLFASKIITSQAAFEK